MILICRSTNQCNRGTDGIGLLEQLVFLLHAVPDETATPILSRSHVTTVMYSEAWREGIGIESLGH